MTPARVVGCAAAFLALAAAAAPAQGAPRLRHCHHCRGFPIDVDPFGVAIPREPFYEDRPPSFVVPPGFGPESEPPFVPDSSPSPGPAPYPQGFSLDVPVKPGDNDATGQRPLEAFNRYRQVADALAQCWNPPAEFDDRPWRQVTLRVSFRRDGSINGVPRIPYVDGGLTEAARSGLRQSLMDALQRCSPLPLSQSLGGAIAGQVFALRFIEQDQD